MLVEVDSATHSVDDRVGLLVNLLLHERVEFSLHDCSKFQFKGFYGLRACNLPWGLISFLFAPQAVDVKLTDMSNLINLGKRQMT